VGGKNASLGEMYQTLSESQINIPNGFATTAQAYRDFLSQNQLSQPIGQLLADLDVKTFDNLHSVGEKIRALILQNRLPDNLVAAIKTAYAALCQSYDQPIQVAVRSSATAEDLPSASFAGQHESYLNISGEEQLLQACLRCYASLFTDRAIKYRHDHGFDHLKVYLSVGVQKMVRSDLASSGVCFTLDPESGFDQVVLITGSWGLGENIVQGAVNPDEFYVFKPTLANSIRTKAGTHLAVSTLCVHGSILEHLNELVISQQADLVVMGTRGAHHLVQKLLGTNTARYIRQAVCPVLAIPQTAHYQGWKKIGYAADFESSDTVFLRQLFGLTRELQAEVCIFNIKSDEQLDLVADTQILREIKKNFPEDRYSLCQMKEMPDEGKKCGGRHPDLYPGKPAGGAGAGYAYAPVRFPGQANAGQQVGNPGFRSHDTPAGLAGKTVPAAPGGANGQPSPRPPALKRAGSDPVPPLVRASFP
jgi:hypothetical protein